MWVNNLRWGYHERLQRFFLQRSNFTGSIIKNDLGKRCKDNVNQLWLKPKIIHTSSLQILYWRFQETTTMLLIILGKNMIEGMSYQFPVNMPVFVSKKFSAKIIILFNIRMSKPMRKLKNLRFYEITFFHHFRSLKIFSCLYCLWSRLFLTHRWTAKLLSQTHFLKQFSIWNLLPTFPPK